MKDILWKQRSIKEDPYHKDQFTYDEDNDCYYCPRDKPCPSFETVVREGSGYGYTGPLG